MTDDLAGVVGSARAAAGPLDTDDLPELDLFGDEYAADPAGTVRRLRARGGLARSVRGIEVLTYERAKQLLAAPRTRSSMRDYYLSEGATPLVVDYIDNGLLAWIEGDRHRRIRSVMERAFSLRSVDQQRAMMREVAERAADRLLAAETADLVADFSYWYPIEVLARLVGVPVDDIPRFVHSSAEMNALAAVPLAPELPRLEQAIRDLGGYVNDLVEQRSKDPGNDLVSALIEAQESLDRLSREELVANIINVIMGGHDTTKLQLASCVHQLAARPGGWARLRDDGAFARRAVTESLRYAPAVPWELRVPEVDLEADGLAIPAGTPMVVNAYAANRDPAAFDRPDDFDPDRDDRQAHLAFGRGRHVCIGNSLARTEMEEALGVLAARVDDVEIAGEITWSGPADALAGPTSLPVRLRAR
ncbi:Cytochrome P450 [Frankia canadensis]|uniref:Cytochrome P450 n=1 Tax=Frankia canadensis TaxID=1836972 RepID=A0A2I2KJD2_9ACTN|nr:cytochrome P450 [Frankia canadensis]SNQ45781.1 Cytochrome P450 [Frankia canadensis]SOU53071.1 Cytochrome P450 [Frankia canadensis]